MYIKDNTKENTISIIFKLVLLAQALMAQTNNSNLLEMLIQMRCRRRQECMFTIIYQHVHDTLQVLQL